MIYQIILYSIMLYHIVSNHVVYIYIYIFFHFYFIFLSYHLIIWYFKSWRITSYIYTHVYCIMIIMICHTVFLLMILWYPLLNHIISYNMKLYHKLYHIVLYHITLHYIILYYTVLHYIIYKDILIYLYNAIMH